MLDMLHMLNSLRSAWTQKGNPLQHKGKGRNVEVTQRSEISWIFEICAGSGGWKRQLCK